MLSFDDVTRWMASFYDVKTRKKVCSGVILGVKEFLTTSSCWKGWREGRPVSEEILQNSSTFTDREVGLLLQMHVQVGQFDARSPDFVERFEAQFSSAFAYSGALDFSILRIARPEVHSPLRVFPCLLNQHGFAHLLKQPAHDVTAVASTDMAAVLKNSFQLVAQWRPLVAAVVTEPCVEGLMCARVANVTSLASMTSSAKSDLDDAAVFVKVGRTRWALVGFGEVLQFGNILVEPLFDLVNWAHRFVK